MSIVSSLKYPVSLGKSEKNQLSIKDGEIIQGRWVNAEDDFEKPVKWAKVKTWGSVVDRSLTIIGDSNTLDELAILTKYENPNTELPQIELLPIDSELFDTDNEPDASKIEEYTDVPFPENAEKVNFLLKKKEEMKDNWIIMMSSCVALIVLNFLRIPNMEGE